MANSPTFMVQLNLDDLNRAMVCLETSQERSEFVLGLQRGVNAARLKDGASDAMSAGYTVGLDARTRAEDFRVKQREGGKISAANRKAKTGTAQPSRSHIEQGSEVTSRPLRTQPRSTSEQSSNQNLEKEKALYQERVIGVTA